MSDSDGYREELDDAKASAPATKGELYHFMLSMRLFQLISETALIALDRGDQEMLKRKLAELNEAGSDFSKFVKEYGRQISSGGDR